MIEASACAVSSGSPAPSLPTKNAGHWALQVGSSSAPLRRIAVFRHSRAAAKASPAEEPPRAAGKRTPEDARNVFAFQRLTVPGSGIMPVAPRPPPNGPGCRGFRVPGPAAITTSGVPANIAGRLKLRCFDQRRDALRMLRHGSARKDFLGYDQHLGIARHQLLQHCFAAIAHKHRMQR